jgi:Protein of unknown function (DUF2541)
MFSKALLSSVAGFSLLALASSPLQAATWVNLGVQSVEFSADRDVFHVGWNHGRFDRLRFRVMGNRVGIADVVVFYGNGSKEHLNVQEHLQPGEITAAYDLKGDHRVIKRIEVLYHTEGSGAYGKARVQIIGARYDGTEPTNTGSGAPGYPGYPGNPGTPGNAGWENLGVLNVGFVSDHDTLPVGAEKGRFRAVKMEVMRHDIYVFNLRVRFMNGDVQYLPVNGLIKAGTSTGYLDLPGDRRMIDRIDVVYKTSGWHLKQAQVALYGKH